MKDLTLQFYTDDTAYYTALRLVAGTVCSISDVDIDATDDFKVCITEGAIILKNNGFEKVTATFTNNGKVACTLSGEGGTVAEADNELSIALISALIDECHIERKGEAISSITLEL